ncbi:hypothetical protein SDRG_16983 [Saprolegnia diclina VS20]|uniref:PX domain-containing protein n=1 Tax=Saprolegnia diclina (strain VS20) TaxID=1156394 RepID=T0R6I9_SAPDV|nr:hypothetical protein SDRG_16983 [Saprolegnia diclina VS20]EQC25127.1 hypothetical protein SDRG_16983 [Saprolegnia diclina VS20]|eukprot:XP_008621438.1 hypothetical protein SDRG_16983 [Saprolegnia diclina VS20]
MFSALSSPTLAKHAEWSCTQRATTGGAKQHVFRLHAKLGSWDLARTFVELEFFRETLRTLYTSEVGSNSHETTWPRRLRHVLTLPFPSVEWLPWATGQLGRFVAALVALYDDAALVTTPTFLLGVLQPLLRKFLDCANVESRFVRATSELAVTYSPRRSYVPRLSAPAALAHRASHAVL